MIATVDRRHGRRFGVAGGFGNDGFGFGQQLLLVVSVRTLSRPISSSTGTASGETRDSTMCTMRPFTRASMPAMRARSIRPEAASARVARSRMWSGWWRRSTS